MRASASLAASSSSLSVSCQRLAEAGEDAPPYKAQTEAPAAKIYLLLLLLPTIPSAAFPAAMGVDTPSTLTLTHTRD